MSMEQTYRDTVAHLSVQLMKHHKHHEAIDNDLKMAGFPTDGTMLTRLESLEKLINEADNDSSKSEAKDKIIAGLQNRISEKDGTIRRLDVALSEATKPKPQNLDQAGMGKIIRDELETKIRVRDNENRILQNQVHTATAMIKDLQEMNEGLRHEIGQLRDELDRMAMEES